MKQKRKPHLSPRAQKLLNLGSGMMCEVLQAGGIPEIVIAAKTTHSAGYLDYIIASPLPKDKILYVLRRVIGLIDGSIPIRTPDEMN
jgi:hypothetical protein